MKIAGRFSMRPKPSLPAMIARFALLAVLLVSMASASDGPTQSIIYNFTGLADGANPMAGLIFGPGGVLYGTTANGANVLVCFEEGACGVAFTLTPPAQSGGTWSENVLYQFQGEDPYPPTSNLVFDQLGNLYGSTDALDDAAQPPVLFQLSQSDGTWNLNSVYGSSSTGQIAAPILDTHRDLYTTVESSDACCGFVLQLSPQLNGSWTQNVLYKFLDGNDGRNPLGGVIGDNARNLYGTTSLGGGPTHCGTVFELSPQPNGKWAESVLHAFTITDGCYPTAGLIFDKQGNLYGTTEFGGQGPCSDDCGVVFELSPPAQKGGAWTETVLHSFAANDGFYPYAGLAIDAYGVLYGTTLRGGSGPCEPTGGGCGTVFSLTPPSQPGGVWTHAFYSFQGPDGIAPYGNVLLDQTHRVLYGTTVSGGEYGYGTVFQIAP
jgi:uncharacterized repeat protein (TIGR03803 family)